MDKRIKVGSVVRVIKDSWRFKVGTLYVVKSIEKTPNYRWFGIDRTKDDWAKNNKYDDIVVNGEKPNWGEELFEYVSPKMSIATRVLYGQKTTTENDS